MSKKHGPIKPIGWNDELDKPIMGRELIDNGTMTVPGKKVVYRSDTGLPLGIVGSGFEVFQNTEIIDFFEGLVGDNKIIYETAGGLGDGESIWVMAEIPDLRIDVKGDESVPYMLIRNGHIGNACLACFPTMVRVVCANTVRAANKEFTENKKRHGVNTTNAGYEIKHTRNMRDVVARVQKSYQACLGDLKLTEEMFNAMAGIQVTTEMKNKFFEFLVDPTKDESKEVSKLKASRQENKIAAFEKLYESPTNQLPGTRNTVYSLLNVATEFIDHERSTRCGEGEDDKTCRFESAMFGSGEKLKAQAMDYLLQLV